MTVQYKSRLARMWFLHAKTTASGKPGYFFSMDDGGALVESVPDGYEIYENINGQVFLRKKTTQVIRPDELALVEATLRKHGEPWRYRAEIKKNTITVYAADDLSGLSRMAVDFGRRPLTESENARFASYQAVLRFVVTDKKSRTFCTERFCFKGGIDDWIFIDGPDVLASQIRQYVKHLGQESFFELF